MIMLSLHINTLCNVSQNLQFFSRPNQVPCHVFLSVFTLLSCRHGRSHSVAAQRAGGKGGVLRPLRGMWVRCPLLVPLEPHTTVCLIGVFVPQSTGGWTSGSGRPDWLWLRRWRTPCERAQRSAGWATWWSSRRGRSHATRRGSTTRSTTFRRLVYFATADVCLLYCGCWQWIIHCQGIIQLFKLIETDFMQSVFVKWHSVHLYTSNKSP